MELENFQPQSKLVTKITQVDMPRFPAFDAHNHLGEDFGGGWDHKPISQLLDLLDSAGIRRYVDLDGGWGETLLGSHLDLFKQQAPDRFMIFGGVDWSQWQEKGNKFPGWAADKLKTPKGARGRGVKDLEVARFACKGQHWQARGCRRSAPRSHLGDRWGIKTPGHDPRCRPGRLF